MQRRKAEEGPFLGQTGWAAVVLLDDPEVRS